MPFHLITEYWPLLLALVVVVWCYARLRSAKQQLAIKQENISKAEAEWMQALDFAEDAMYLVDLDDRLVRGNRKFFEFIGRPAEECLGQPIMLLIHGAHEQQPCPVCTARLERRDAVFVKESNDPMNRLGRPIELIVKTRRDAHGEPVGVLMVLRDLSRQRQTEEAILESRERLMVTLESMGEAVITTDVSGVVQYLNPVAQHLTGWSNTDAPGRPLAEVFRITEDSTGSHAR